MVLLQTDNNLLIVCLFCDLLSVWEWIYLLILLVII